MPAGPARSAGGYDASLLPLQNGYWTKTYDSGKGEDIATGVASDPDGNFVITGGAGTYYFLGGAAGDVKDIRVRKYPPTQYESTRWFLAEGTTAWGFECWLLIRNPNPTEATCLVTHMIEGSGPSTKTRKIPANSRKTFNMEEDIGRHDASILVDSNYPVIPERAMYKSSRREGHESVGTTAWGFTTCVLVQNPNGGAVKVQITYMTPTGKGNVTKEETIPGNSRSTFEMGAHGGIS